MALKKLQSQLCVDFPAKQERIASPDYTFRIGSRVEGPVELSIDGGEWTPCRPAVGYWWFDWSCGKPGRHKAVARVVSETGLVVKTLVRYFYVGQVSAKPARAGKASLTKSKAVVSGRSGKKPAGIR